MGQRIHGDSQDRTGFNATPTADAGLLFEAYPAVPTQGIGRTGLEAVALGAGEADPNGWRLRPFGFQGDAGALWVVLSEVLIGADLSADLTFRALRRGELEHGETPFEDLLNLQISG